MPHYRVIPVDDVVTLSFASNIWNEGGVFGDIDYEYLNPLAVGISSYIPTYVLAKAAKIGDKKAGVLAGLTGAAVAGMDLKEMLDEEMGKVKNRHPSGRLSNKITRELAANVGAGTLGVLGHEAYNYLKAIGMAAKDLRGSGIGRLRSYIHAARRLSPLERYKYLRMLPTNWRKSFWIGVGAANLGGMALARHRLMKDLKRMMKRKDKRRSSIRSR